MKVAIIEGTAHSLENPGTVANVVRLADGWTGAPGEWQCPTGLTPVDDDGSAVIGGTWDGAGFGPAPGPDPMDEWLSEMAASDVELMPRWMEDHIEADHGGTTANPNLQAKYDAKKALRAAKPQG